MSAHLLVPTTLEAHQIMLKCARPSSGQACLMLDVSCCIFSSLICQDSDDDTEGKLREALKDNKLLNAELKKRIRAAAVVAEDKAQLQLEVTRLEEVVTRLEQEALRTSGERK